MASTPRKSYSRLNGGFSLIVKIRVSVRCKDSNTGSSAGHSPPMGGWLNPILADKSKPSAAIFSQANKAIGNFATLAVLNHCFGVSCQADFFQRARVLFFRYWQSICTLNSGLLAYVANSLGMAKNTRCQKSLGSANACPPAQSNGKTVDATRKVLRFMPP